MEILQRAKDIGALSMVHCENGDMVAWNAERLNKLGVTGPEGHLLSRNKDVEGESTYRMTVLANEINAPLYVVHVMG